MRIVLLGLVLLSACGDDDVRIARDAGPRADAGRLDGGTRLDAGPGPNDAGVDAASTDDGGGIDSGRDAALGDAGWDAALADAGREDAGLPDAGLPDAGLPDAGSSDAALPDAGSAGVAVFPTEAAAACALFGCSPLRGGGGGTFYQTGVYLEETVVLGSPSISTLALAIEMDDHTSGCAEGESHTFDVFVNSVRVGAYSFTTPIPAGAPRRIAIDSSLAFPAVPGVAGSRYTIRLVATSTVCPGGSSWNWFPGGTVSATSP